MIDRRTATSLCIAAVLSACSRTAPAGELRSPPTTLAIPQVANHAIPAAAAWTRTAAAGWTHLHAPGPTDVYLHGGRAYQLVRAQVSYGGPVVAPYLLDVTGTFSGAAGARAATGPAGAAYPRPGTAVLSADSGTQHTLDVVFSDRGSVKTLRDYTGPKAVLVFEHECIGCRMEIAQIRALALFARRANGVVVVATSARKRRVSDDLAKAGIDAPVVLDDRNSLYALLDVGRVPLGYFLSRDGRILDTSIGNLDDREVTRLANEIAAR